MALAGPRAIEVWIHVIMETLRQLPNSSLNELRWATNLLISNLADFNTSRLLILLNPGSYSGRFAFTCRQHFVLLLSQTGVQNVPWPEVTDNPNLSPDEVQKALDYLDAEALALNLFIERRSLFDSAEYPETLREVCVCLKLEVPILQPYVWVTENSHAWFMCVTDVFKSFASNQPNPYTGKAFNPTTLQTLYQRFPFEAKLAGLSQVPYNPANKVH